MTFSWATAIGVLGVEKMAKAKKKTKMLITTDFFI
jgi:hypothetical protein